MTTQDIAGDTDEPPPTTMLDVHMRLGDGNEVVVGHVARGHGPDELRHSLAALMHNAGDLLEGDEPPTPEEDCT